MTEYVETCKSKGCDRPIRFRPFKGSLKQHPEKTCRSCQGTVRRHGLTKPEWDAVKAFRKERKADV